MTRRLSESDFRGGVEDFFRTRLYSSRSMVTHAMDHITEGVSESEIG